MIIALFLVGLLIVILLDVLFKVDWEYYDWVLGMWCFFGAILLVWGAIEGCILCNRMTIDDRIAMYQEENALIEQRVASTVDKYMQFERDVMVEVSPEDDIITLVALYPELKSDELVKQEMQLYIDNNKTIKELKAKKINKRVHKFLLYFGR